MVSWEIVLKGFRTGFGDKNTKKKILKKLRRSFAISSSAAWIKMTNFANESEDINANEFPFFFRLLLLRLIVQRTP